MYFNLKNKVRIKITGAPLRFEKFLHAELNFLSKCEPKSDDKLDVLVEFSDQLKFTQHSIIHKPPIGYDSEGVFWFDPNHNIARINFSNFDTGLTKLIVSNNFNTHFFYILILYLISFKSIKNEGFFCHASAVKYRGKTIIFPAWRHVGKTNLMLELLKDGADLISDDGIIYYSNGEISSFSKRLHLLYFNFLSYPELLKEIDERTAKLIEFIDKARDGKYNLSEKSIQEVLKLIRARIPNSKITKKEFNPKNHKCNLIVHLNKNFSVSLSPPEIVKIDIENLSIKTTESSLFELDHFIEAYKISSLVEGKISNVIDQCRDKIRNISLQAFSHADDHLELNFSNFLDSTKAKKLLDTYLDES